MKTGVRPGACSPHVGAIHRCTSSLHFMVSSVPLSYILTYPCACTLVTLQISAHIQILILLSDTTPSRPCSAGRLHTTVTSRSLARLEHLDGTCLFLICRAGCCRSDRILLRALLCGACHLLRCDLLMLRHRLSVLSYIWARVTVCMVSVYYCILWRCPSAVRLESRHYLCVVLLRRRVDAYRTTVLATFIASVCFLPASLSVNTDNCGRSVSSV
jgi:hypothetical protein